MIHLDTNYLIGLLVRGSVEAVKVQSVRLRGLCGTRIKGEITVATRLI